MPHLGQRGYKLNSYNYLKVLSMQTFKYANFRELLVLQESFVDRPAPTACDHLPEIHRAKTKLAPIRTITITKNQQVLDQLGWAAKACPVPRAWAISL